MRLSKHTHYLQHAHQYQLISTWESECGSLACESLGEGLHRESYSAFAALDALGAFRDIVLPGKNVRDALGLSTTCCWPDDMVVLTRSVRRKVDGSCSSWRACGEGGPSTAEMREPSSLGRALLLPTAGALLPATAACSSRGRWVREPEAWVLPRSPHTRWVGGVGGSMACAAHRCFVWVRLSRGVRIVGVVVDGMVTQSMGCNWCRRASQWA